MNRTFLILTAILLLEGNVRAQTTIFYGDQATVVQKTAAFDLAADLKRVTTSRIEVTAYSTKNSLSRGQQVIFVGTPSTHSGIRELVQKGQLSIRPGDPGPEAFLLQSLRDTPRKGTTTLVIAGNDDRGTLYGVYEFSRRILGVDPWEYWTGKHPPKMGPFTIPDLSFREKSPLFPLRGYFDNDDDLIANWKGKRLIIEFDIWKEMINSLARMRYNYIDLHDTFGRAEFWNWDYYKKMGTYHTDLDLINKIIDYAHSKGMLVQAPMYLGWEFYHLDYDKICLSRYFDDWMKVYTYYLTRTPIGKCDLFLQRPRDPWWDSAYRCPEESQAGINPGPLMTKMFNGLLERVNAYRPGGKVICDLWSEGRTMWRANEFNPDRSIDMLWADDGYGAYSEWPDDLKGHHFGIYVHAGFWLNNVVQDPYPEVILKSTREAVKRGLTYNYFVNGQNFKNFILNLEACAHAAWDPQKFDAEKFYLEWTERYFGARSAPLIVESLKQLHNAHEPIGGFAKLMGYTARLLKNLQEGQFKHTDSKPIQTALKTARQSRALAIQAEKWVPEESALLYDDQILFPAKIFQLNLQLACSVADIMNAAADGSDPSLPPSRRKAAVERLSHLEKEAQIHLEKLRQVLQNGSRWKKWAGWYDPDHFRVFTPPPTMDDLKKAVHTVSEKLTL
ncbi:MAG: hypothetical protein GXO76_12705 [Calditrichaeota bacterium]|nr:hypothetical protein [Calditrichota bacterium]